MLVAWELPADDDVLAAWFAALPGHVIPRFRGHEEVADGLVLAHWETELEREDYPDGLNALVAANLACLARWPWPDLYELDVQYAAERCGEVWRTFPALLVRGVGDCASLGPARCAELVARGVEAHVLLELQSCDPSGACLWHVRVATPHGPEDPSAVLGMGWSETVDTSGPYGALCPIRS